MHKCSSIALITVTVVAALNSINLMDYGRFHSIICCFYFCEMFVFSLQTTIVFNFVVQQTGAEHEQNDMYRKMRAGQLNADWCDGEWNGMDKNYFVNGNLNNIIEFIYLQTIGTARLCIAIAIVNLRAVLSISPRFCGSDGAHIQCVALNHTSFGWPFAHNYESTFHGSVANTEQQMHSIS